MGKLTSTCILTIAVLISVAGTAEAAQKSNGNGIYLLNCRLMNPRDPLYSQHCKAETVVCSDHATCRRKRFGGRASDGRPERVVSRPSPRETPEGTPQEAQTNIK